jgi:hypothetical protein
MFHFYQPIKIQFIHCGDGAITSINRASAVQKSKRARIAKSVRARDLKSRHCESDSRAGQLKLLISLSDETSNRGPRIQLLELGHISVSVSCTILQKSKMTNTLHGDSSIWATGGENKWNSNTNKRVNFSRPLSSISRALDCELVTRVCFPDGAGHFRCDWSGRKANLRSFALYLCSEMYKSFSSLRKWRHIVLVNCLTVCPGDLTVLFWIQCGLLSWSRMKLPTPPPPKESVWFRPWGRSEQYDIYWYTEISDIWW